MNSLALTDYFLRPSDPAHRRYEALRAVFVEQCSLKDVARQFEVSYGTVRNWVSEFRQGVSAGQPPPFSLLSCGGVPQGKASIALTIQTSKSPMSRTSHWNLDAD